MLNKKDFAKYMKGEFSSLTRTDNGQLVAYFDGPGGTQVPDVVIDAMSAYMKNGVSNIGGVFPTAIETVKHVDKAREYAAALLGASKQEIAFGANTTTLALRMSRTIFRSFEKGKGNIVTTEMDHHANVDPWITAAKDKELEINTIKFNPETYTLDIDNIDTIITKDTKLVAIGLASNAIGTINDVKPVIDRAKEVGALISIDAVHAIPHFLVDFKELSVDILFCSAYKFFGPHVGIVAIKEDLFEKINPYKLQPATNIIPNKIETGTINFSGLVGVSETIKFLASIGEGDLLRDKLISSYKKIETHENELAKQLRQGLDNINHVTLHQANEPNLKTPTIAFQVDGMDSREVCKQLAEKHSLYLENGDFYAMTLVKRLKIKSEGLIRAGIAPYNTENEIKRLIEAVKLLQ